MTYQLNPENTCPLCGNDNACAIAQGLPAESCWCRSQAFDNKILDSIPREARGKYCICASCGRPTQSRDDYDGGSQL